MSDYQAVQTPASKIRTPRRAVAAMFLLNGAYYGIWASRVPAIAEQHQLGEAQLGLLLLSMCAGAIISFPITGQMVDKYGSASVTKKIAFMYGAALTALALVPNVWLLAVALFLFGATHGAMDVSMNAWAGEVERKMKRPIMASFHAMWSVGAGLGAASGYVAVNMGAIPMVHFLVGAAAFLAFTLPFGLIPWQSPRSEPTAKKKVTLLAIPRGALAFVGIIGFCSAMGEGAMADWSAVYLVQVVQSNEAIAALGYASYSSTMVIMRLLGDRIITKLGAVRAARISGVFAVSGSLLAIFVATLPAVLVGFALMGMGYALIFPLMFSRAANDDKLSPGTAIAAVATFGYGGGLLGPVLIGLLADVFTLRWALLVLSTLAIAIVVLAPYLAPASESPQSDTPDAGV